MIVAPVRGAFTLLEMLAVIALVAVLAALAAPAVSTILRGSQLTQASQLVVSQLSLARQTALTRNQPVEVRFYRYAASGTPGEDASRPETGSFRALQLFAVHASGPAAPLDKMQALPAPVVFSASASRAGLSSLLDRPTAGAPKAPPADDASFPRLPGSLADRYEFLSFRFQPDGSTDLSPTGLWYLTLLPLPEKMRDPAVPPPNFFTLQIDPISGLTRSFRPVAE